MADVARESICLGDSQDFESGFNISKNLERLEDRQAIHIFDARPDAPPDSKAKLRTIHDRVNLPDHQAMLAFTKSALGITEEELSNIKGKTFVVAYAKYGHGHKHQALDFAASLALTLDARVVLVDPMEGLPVRETKAAFALKRLHGALQHNDVKRIQEIQNELGRLQSSASGYLLMIDKLTDRLTLFMSKVGTQAVPAQEASGNSGISEKRTVATRVVEVLKSHPKLYRQIINALNLAIIESTERSISTATAGIAAHFDAEAIITTIPLGIRSLSKDALRWLPKELRTKAELALRTVLMLIPDTGYTYRNVDPHRETQPDPKDANEAMLLTAYHSIPRFFSNTTVWLRNAISVTADRVMANSLINNWKAHPDSLAPLGTSSDTISAEKFQKKWAQISRNLLFASNGNGSNIPDFSQAIDEISAKEASLPNYLQKHNLHLDLYLANHPFTPDGINLVGEIIKRLHKAGISDEQIQLIDHSKTFLAGQPPEYDPTKLIHIGYASGDASSSDLKQWMQIWSHIEIRSPGENALTGAAVGTLELCTPPGGPNEVFNMIETMRRWIAFAIDWPKKDVWNNPYYNINLPPLQPHTDATFPDLVEFFLQRLSSSGVPLATLLAQAAYEQVDKQANPKIVALLVRELLAHQRHIHPRDTSDNLLPSRQTWIERITRFGRERNRLIFQGLHPEPSSK